VCSAKGRLFNNAKCTLDDRKHYFCIVGRVCCGRCLAAGRYATILWSVHKMYIYHCILTLINNYCSASNFRSCLLSWLQSFILFVYLLIVHRNTMSAIFNLCEVPKFLLRIKNSQLIFIHNIMNEISLLELYDTSQCQFTQSICIFLIDLDISRAPQILVNFFSHGYNSSQTDFENVIILNFTAI
jgi:hypothetical protein